SRDRPEIMDVFARLRALADRYPDRYLIGEVADVDTIAVSAKYTGGVRALHSSYHFQFAQEDLGTARLSTVVDRTERLMGDGWITYAFGNHDTMRAVSRWRRLTPLSGDDPALAELLMALLLSLRGGACIYQGDELGLTEADIALEDLQDPWGKEFWPHFKGRDGCRTPIPWQADAPNAGFTTGKPWLPVPAEHRPLAVDRQESDPGSVLNAYRRFLAWRKGHEALIHGDFTAVDAPAPVYAFERRADGIRLLCAFNISNRPASTELAPGWRPLEGHGFYADLTDCRLTLPAFGAFFGARA
ncbi:MAG TPA: alpha-amylase family glycosyl hydrolase, partial [Alphaproteobacteria bacterium]|nr:alpha-amylase family glycosyl hydrolase [Alphaproteobacteria bacterium]